jgi:hypothetical protein
MVTAAPTCVGWTVLRERPAPAGPQADAATFPPSASANAAPGSIVAAIRSFSHQPGAHAMQGLQVELVRGVGSDKFIVGRCCEDY